MKTADMNQEKLRIRLLEIFKGYPKPASITQMKEVIAEYDSVVELLHETLNASIGIMDAIVKKEIKDKKEEAGYVKEITTELTQRSYLGGVH
jgi:hypothetical protein